MKFNKKKCLELLKKRNDLQKNGKLFRNYDKVKHDELISYLTLIEDKIFCKSAKGYFQILDSFINKTITIDQFLNQFYSIRGSNLKLARTLKKKLEEEALGVFPQSTEINIEIDPKSYGITKLISSLHSLVELYDPDVTLEMNLKQPELVLYGISEEFIRFKVKKDFLPELKKYCKKS